MLRILIVDDQKSIRETLKAVLASEPDFEVVATTNNGQTAAELATKLLPDLMLVDLEMPGLDGLNLTRLIHQDFPSIKVIVLSTHDKDEYIQQSLQAGAMGYLLKNTSAQDLREAIRFVDRGYTQFSPGLLHKVIPSVETKSALTTSNPTAPNESLKKASPNLNNFKVVNLVTGKPQRIRKSWKLYLPYWLVGNAVLWGLAIAYLLLKSPTYTSKWAISLPSGRNSSSVSIPDIGSVSSNNDSPYNNALFDPRADYRFLLGEKEVLSMAAAQAGMKSNEFGKPHVEIVDNTTMMEISMEGDTPKEAQQKGIALQSILERKLQELRQGQISQTDDNLKTSLEKSERALTNARQKLADFKAEFAVGSTDKAKNLSENLENLRRQNAEVEAQLQQTRAQAERLSNNLGLSPQLAKDAFALHSDSLFQQYLSEFTRLSGELVSIEAQFQAGSPAVVEKQQQTEAARQALLQRGGTLLGRTPSPELLQQLNLRTGDDSGSYRGSLLKDVVSLQSQAEGFAAQAAELEQQVTQLEGKENTLVEQGSNIDKLEQEVKFAETVYSSNLAKSRLAESNLYNAYPQIQIAIQPSLPKKPTSPNPALVCLGTFMGSVFLTTALASLWSNSTKTTPPSSNSNNNNNHKAIASNSSLNDLLKK